MSHQWPNGSERVKWMFSYGSSNVNDANLTLSVIKGDFDIVYVVKPR